MLDVTDLEDYSTINEYVDEKYTAVRYDGKTYTAKAKASCCDDCGYDTLELGRELGEAEAKGTLQVLWENFGGSGVIGSDGNAYRLLDSHVRVIYGEAIGLQMAAKIYKGMADAGWSVGNVFFGVGSWAFIGNSSRDSYGLAMKATNSEVAGEDYPLQKDPKGTSSFKKSAKGRLRVEYMQIDDKFVLFDEQSELQEEMGELQVVFENSVITKEQIFRMVVARATGPYIGHNSSNS